MTACSTEPEGKTISLEDEERIRKLIDDTTKEGRVCLRMLERGETIVAACAAEQTDPKATMAYWHHLTDSNNILSTDGKRPCISTLENAWKRKWATSSVNDWIPLNPSLKVSPLSNPFAH